MGFRDQIVRSLEDVTGVNWILASGIAGLALILSILLPDREYVVVAAAAALIIAFVAYPWQKRKDRELKIDEEKRKALAEFFGAVENARNQLAAARFNPETRAGAFLALDTHLDETQNTLAMVQLIGDEKTNDLVEQCQRLRDCLWLERGHLRHEKDGRGLFVQHEEMAKDSEEARGFVDQAYNLSLKLARADLYSERGRSAGSKKND